MIVAYQAVDAAGKRKRDVLEARSTREAIETLRSRGLFVTEMTEKPRDERVSKAALTPGHSVRLPISTLVLFTRQMTMLLRAGSGIVPAIQAIRRQMKKPRHKALLAQLAADLEEGTSLTDALRKHPRAFDAVYCAVIAAGEASGQVPAMFEKLTDMVGKKRAMRKKVLGALAYPALLIAMSAHIILALLFFVLPRFGDMFVQLGVDIPQSTKILLDTGTFLHANGMFLLVGVVVLALGVTWALTRAQGKQFLSNLQTEIPILGKLRSRLIQAQFIQTMGLLLESRVGLLDTLALARRATGNRRFQRLFDEMDNAVTSGGKLSTALEESAIIEPYICQAVSIGEDSGNLGGALIFCADMLDETNTELIGVVTKLLEPAILMVMGFVVGTVAISLFVPLFDLTAAMG